MADLRKFRALARNWEALGRTDPLFGVLSDPTKYGGKWDQDEFFASGRAHVDKLLRTLADARASFLPGTCLDFGCGVGRLTIPLADSFHHTIGVDVARPMVDAAARHRPPGARCEFIVNRDPDLRRFETGTFDVVHSCLVLQHIPPEVALRYVAEFFRVTRPGGLVVFQIPAETRTESQISASHALPEAAYAAEVAFLSTPGLLETSALTSVSVRVTNRGSVTWRHDIPAGRHICLGNHWLHEDGRRAIDEDGRARLPRPVEPGEAVEIALEIQAPGAPGRYLLEVDLVQEHVCWFHDRGSLVVRVPLQVVAAPPRERHEPASPRAVAARPPTSGPRVSWLGRLCGSLRRGAPSFEMHVVPRLDVEQTIHESGGRLLRAVDDNAAGPGWLSYSYVCQKL